MASTEVPGLKSHEGQWEHVAASVINGERELWFESGLSIKALCTEKLVLRVSLRKAEVPLRGDA